MLKTANVTDRAVSRAGRKSSTEKGTKWDIFVVSVELFAQCGVDAISVRTIAAEVGIQAGSIYNHFSSKEQLVKEMYEFYLEHAYHNDFDVESLLALVETEEPVDVLNQFIIHYSGDHEDLMGKIIQIAMSRMHTDEQAMQLVKYVYDIRIDATFKVVLEKMMELGKIRPVDLEAYVELYKCLCLGGSYRMHSPAQLSHEIWHRINREFFGLLENSPSLD